MKKFLFILLFLPLMADAQILDSLNLLRWAAQQQIHFRPSKSDSLIVDDSVWSDMVNRACIRVAYDANCIYKESSFVTVAGTRNYIIDTSMIDVDYVLKVRNKTVRPLTKWFAPFLKQRWPDTALSKLAFSPHAYWYFADSVWFYPTPVRADTMLIGYMIYPTNLLADDSTTNIPVEFREAIVWYTCHLALWRMGRIAESKEALGRYTQEIQIYKMGEANKYDLMAPKQ